MFVLNDDKLTSDLEKLKLVIFPLTTVVFSPSNNSNFALSSPDIVIDSILDMSNHYDTSSGAWLIDNGGEEYELNFSYTNDDTTHNNFLTQASDIEQTIGYAVSINDNFNVVENSLFVRSFSSYNDVNWSISGGDDKSKFKINENTGSLTFVSRPDYENPNDSNKDNIYNLLVRSISSDIFIEFSSWNPHAEILFRFKRQPSESKICPKSLAIDLI